MVTALRGRRLVETVSCARPINVSHLRPCDLERLTRPPRVYLSPSPEVFS